LDRDDPRQQDFTIMDLHAHVSHHAVHSLDGLTAFSALPDAPVLPVKQRRQPLRAALRALRQPPAAARPVRALSPTTSAANVIA
jgi:hypothetical protein